MAADLLPTGSESNCTSWEVEDGASDGEHAKYGHKDGGSDDKLEMLQALWGQLQDRRSTARELRAKLSKKRAKLRELRKQKDDTDNNFMGLIRPHFPSSHRLSFATDLIIRRFNEMQSIRSAYHVLENEVEELEIQLDKEQASRETLETRFFSYLEASARGNRPQDASPSESDTDSYAPPSRASLLGIPVDRPADIHPLYRRLLDAVGDRELAREHHMDLVMHRDSILYNLDLSLKRGRQRAAEGNPNFQAPVSDDDDQLEPLKVLVEEPGRLDEIRALYKLAINEDDYDFLKVFGEEEANVQNKLEEAKEECERLMQLCKRMGVMRKNAPYHEEYTIFSETDVLVAAGTMSINQEHGPELEDGLADPRFPVLLSNPRHILEPEPLTAKGALKTATMLARDDPSRAQLVAASMKEYGISTLLVEAAGENKSDYINRWLLHRLRTSPLEAELLYTIFSTKLKVRNLRRWQEDVLYYWSRDRANRPVEAFEGPITTRDSLVIDGDTCWDNFNSVIEVSSQPQSEPGDTSKRPSRRPSRLLRTVY